jgi:hypothetical protein
MDTGANNWVNFNPTTIAGVTNADELGSVN